MKLPFRLHHLFHVLALYESGNLPLDVLLSGYFRAHKAVGAKDRQAIAETIYGMIRWRGLLDHLCLKPPSWEKRQALYAAGFNPAHYLDDASIPLHIRVSFPKAFFSLLLDAHSEEKARDLCLVSNTPAPTTIRVNTLKTTRDALMEKWRPFYSVSPCTQAETGIVFHKRINFFSLPEFKDGLFEIQDEGSQLLASLVTPLPGQHVLDFCAGSGGKTLAFAPLMHHRGQIYLHDVRPHALDQAKKRLKRAGIQNAQILTTQQLHKTHLKQKMDWVLVDAPCSGSGTLRRNPDMKWKFTPSMVEELIAKQRDIFSQALEFLHPDGKIVYATCSILPQENQHQLSYFLHTFSLELVSEPFSCLPQKDGMDGFFGAVLKRKILP